MFAAERGQCSPRAAGMSLEGAGGRRRFSVTALERISPGAAPPPLSLVALAAAVRDGCRPSPRCSENSAGPGSSLRRASAAESLAAAAATLRVGGSESGFRPHPHMSQRHGSVPDLGRLQSAPVAMRRPSLLSAAVDAETAGSCTRSAAHRWRSEVDNTLSFILDVT